MKQLFFFCMLVLAGCATDTVRVEDQPLVYRQAYRHGCASGYAAAGSPNHRLVKNVPRYKNIALYRQGWTKGFEVCEGRYEESVDESTEEYDYY
jgi:hypothetical protein